MSRPLCPRGAVAASVMLVTLPLVFGLWQDWPSVFTDDPRAFLTILGAWLACTAALGWLAFHPGRLPWLREALWSLFVALWVLWGADRLPMVRQYGDHALIFQPGTTVRYESAEYSITATANNFGFRDRNFTAVPAPGVHRILVVGDSYVYGWGLPVEASWPRRLEEALQGEGVRVEVANLGQPGASPFQYANVLRKALSVLHPDAVVVAISESNDLWQCQPAETPTPFRQFLQKPLGVLFPNLSDMLYQRRHPSEFKDLHSVWLAQSNQLLADASAPGMPRFKALDTDVQNAYRQGELNPSELASVLFNPVSLTVFAPDDPVVAGQVRILSNQLGRMRRACSRYGCPLLVVGIPAGECVNRACWEGQRRAGFELPPALLGFAGYDEAVTRAAAAAGVPFFSAAPAFQARLGQKGLFYSLDNHLAADGCRLLADEVAVPVRKLLR